MKEKKIFVFALFLFLLALSARLFASSKYAGEPVWDGHYYAYYAKRMLDGFGYSDNAAGVIDGVHSASRPASHYPVGYSTFLYLVYSLFGADINRVQIANAVTGALFSVLTWSLARMSWQKDQLSIYEEGFSFAAGLLVALNPGLVLYSVLVMSEPLAGALTLFSFFVLLSFLKTKSFRLAFYGSSFCLGISALVRPQALFCAPFMVFVFYRHFSGLSFASLFFGEEKEKEKEKGEEKPSPLSETDLKSFWKSPRFRKTKWRRRKDLLLVATFYAACCMFPVLPWSVRNCFKMDGCAFISTNGGWNLAIGSFPRATGRFEGLSGADGCKEVTGQVQQDRCWFKYGIKQIKSHPIFWLSLIPKKLSYTFDHESFQIGYLKEADPDSWPHEKAEKWRVALSSVHQMLICFGAFGAFFSRFNWPKTWRQRAFIWALILSFFGLCYGLFTSSPIQVWPLALWTCFWGLLPRLPDFSTFCFRRNLKRDHLESGNCIGALLFSPSEDPEKGKKTRGELFFIPASDASILMAGFLLSTVVTHILFFGEDRYHVAVTPVFCFFSCSLNMFSQIKKRSRHT